MSAPLEFWPKVSHWVRTFPGLLLAELEQLDSKTWCEIANKNAVTLKDTHRLLHINMHFVQTETLWILSLISGLDRRRITILYTYQDIELYLLRWLLFHFTEHLHIWAWHIVEGEFPCGRKSVNPYGQHMDQVSSTLKPVLLLGDTMILQDWPKTGHPHEPQTWRRGRVFNMRNVYQLFAQLNVKHKVTDPKVQCSHQVYCILFARMTQFVLLRHGFCVTLVTLQENPHCITPCKWQYQSSPSSYIGNSPHDDMLGLW